MAFIQRANVILEVNDDFLDNYLSQGYNQIDEQGNIIRNGLPNSLNDYKLAYDKLRKEIKALKAENEQLTVTITKLKTLKSNKSKTDKE